MAQKAGDEMQLHNTSEIYEQLQWSEGGIVCTRRACQIAAMTPDSRKMSVPNASEIYKLLLWSEGSIVCTH